MMLLLVVVAGMMHMHGVSNHVLQQYMLFKCDV